MLIKIQRHTRKPSYTVGKVYIDGSYFCDSLEDTDRGATQVMPFTYTSGNAGYWTKPDFTRIEKIPGKTAIPTGRYDVCSYWWEKYKCYVPMLLRVGGFTGILMHNGMTAEHTEGCPLLGRNNSIGRLDGSRLYMDALASRVLACEKRGEKVTIEIV